MSWYYDLPLRRQLFVGILPVVAVCVAVVGITFHAIGMIGAAGDEFGTVQVPALIGLLELNMGVSDMRRVELAMTLAKINKDDAAYAKRVEEYKISILKNGIEKGRALYEPLPRTSEEEVLWKESVKELADWTDTWRCLRRASSTRLASWRHEEAPILNEEAVIGDSRRRLGSGVGGRDGRLSV